MYDLDKNYKIYSRPLLTLAVIHPEIATGKSG